MRDADSTASLEDYKLAPPLITIMMGDTSGGPSRWRPPTTTTWRATRFVPWLEGLREKARVGSTDVGREVGDPQRPPRGGRAVQRLDLWRHAASPPPFGGNGAGLTSAWRNAASNADRQSG